MPASLAAPSCLARVTHTLRVFLRVYGGAARAVDGADGNGAAMKRWCTPRSMSTTSDGMVGMEGKIAAGRGYLGEICVLRACRVALSSGDGMVGIQLK